MLHQGEMTMKISYFVNFSIISSLLSILPVSKVILTGFQLRTRNSHSFNKKKTTLDFHYFQVINPQVDILMSA